MADPVVLIVDDNDDNRFTLSMRLEACGYENIVRKTDAGTDKHTSPISIPSHTIAWFFIVTRSPMRAPVSIKA